MEQILLERFKQFCRNERLKRMRENLRASILKMVNDTNEKSGYNEALHRELDDDKLIPHFRMPQANKIYQPGGKGSTLVVEMNPNCTLAKRLLKEAQYRYFAVWDFEEIEMDYGLAGHCRVTALAGFLNRFPGLKGKVSVGEDTRGPTLNAPNDVVELDFVVIAPDGKYHLQRFTNDNVGHVCAQLHISYYQSKK
ncbi:hypothetical protein FDI85_gp248 [Erwinia phage Machina]|uniref:Uncharacterized protein n=2 Tax=Machinavirus machina TaxID=2169990 RepID=A0A1B2ICY2_9CAUD|nr:hypothetical protein BIZ81_gp246 [Erwinia phage vB_EamM_Huxley]YP_009616953.1 hypothetical protein FDI85_gp248 [Erwinia phage Machina]ANZ49119.1 hypothetical protein HUXLEY_37 [Erwinia phage vB_EamM_Huxley]ANZ49674.1 hypothetical protein MACHINA_36 [Erwinia phage Machina]ANZ49947.1 hypothetical protein PARSHIK_38 [Erwinia phage vB_EamM_Parshik]